MGVRENFAGGHFHNFHWLEEGRGGGGGHFR